MFSTLLVDHCKERMWRWRPWLNISHRLPFQYYIRTMPRITLTVLNYLYWLTTAVHNGYCKSSLRALRLTCNRQQIGLTLRTMFALMILLIVSRAGNTIVSDFSIPVAFRGVKTLEEVNISICDMSMNTQFQNIKEKYNNRLWGLNWRGGRGDDQKQ